MNRNTLIKATILRVLSRMPSGILKGEEMLITEVRMEVTPQPSDAETRLQIRELEQDNLIVGMHNKFANIQTWQITDAGKVQLSQI